MKKIFLKLGRFVRKHRWSIMLISLALVVGGFFIYDTLSATLNRSITDLFIPQKEKEVLVTAPLSGIQIKEEQANKRPLAVVVENHPDARPQSGLSEADLIFETLAEGGITRFLAIFQSQESEEIGPIRSARPYFVDWSLGYDAIFAHIGGSEEALNQIIKQKVADLNQFYNPAYFWRSNKRYAPHNVYSTTEKIRLGAANRKYNVEKSDIPALTFKKDILFEERPESQIFKVNFNYNYAPTYTYNKECNCYLRSYGTVKHLDANGKQLSAKNVAVLFSDMGSKKFGNNTYTTIDTIDTGKAYFYIDGKKIDGTWSRTSQQSPIKFFGSDGNTINFNVGTTWIDVVPKGTIVQ